MIILKSDIYLEINILNFHPYKYIGKNSFKINLTLFLFLVILLVFMVSK